MCHRSNDIKHIWEHGIINKLKENSMKQILTMLAIFLSFMTYGQDREIFGKSFIMKQNYLAQKCNAVGENLVNTTDVLERTFIIVVEAETLKGYVVSVLRFDEGVKDTNAVIKAKELNSKFVENMTLESKKMYFFIPFTDFDKVCKKIILRDHFTLGISTVPIKIRFGNSGNGEDGRFFALKGMLV